MQKIFFFALIALDCGIAFNDSIPYQKISHHKRRTSTSSTQLKGWELGPSVVMGPHYITPVVKCDERLQIELMQKLKEYKLREQYFDPLWEQIRTEAQVQLENEPSSGPQLYTNILSHPSLISAITSIVSHEISTQLIPATLLQNLFIEMLHPLDDARAISYDVMASALRSPTLSDGNLLISVLFNQGLHALVCHRLSHRLWLSGRTGLAYYIQSTVSRKYSTDIHPGARFGSGIYLNAGSAGVVIGETAVVHDDVIILQGVTLGGTGKERGDRHPKVQKKAILEQSCTVLGNISIGEGAIIGAKSIVTKPVPSYTKANGVPAKLSGEVRPFNIEEEHEHSMESASNELEYLLEEMSRLFWEKEQSKLNVM